MVEQSLVPLKKKSLLDIIIDTFLIIMVTIAIIIAILSMTIIIKKTINPKKVPDIMGIKPFIVLSGSMEPTVKVGDMVFVQEIDPKELKIGDIISFRLTNDDIVLIHRIVRIETEDENINLITKGDNNKTEDEFVVNCKNVEGIYIARLAQIGTIAMFIRTFEGTVICVLSIMCIFFLWQLIKTIKREKITRKRLKECQEILEEIKIEKEVRKI